jgi:hypothetical protein
VFALDDRMLHVAPLVALGFANLLMLGWLGAAAAPIIIHLWSKRRYREAPWAAMEFLLAALRKNSRRLRLEQWLLLAVRTAVMLLVALALAQPYVERLGLSFVPGQRTLKVFVIDGSYSMAYKPTDKSRFDRARQLAAQIVEDSPQGDAFLLVLMASPPSVIVGTPAAEPRDFLAEIDNLKRLDGGADLAATLVLLEGLLTKTETAGLEQREVYFLTDLGRNTWAGQTRSGDDSDYRARLSRLAQLASLMVVDLGQSNSENLAVTSLSALEPLVTTDREISLAAQIHNFGTQPRNHHLVELRVDDQRVKETYVDVAAGEHAGVTFSHRFDTLGDHVVEVRAGPDLLDVDNHRWLSIPVKERVRVLCVNGKPATTPMSGAADYVALALNPSVGDPTAPSVITPEVIPESGLLERDLASYDCVFLCNVAQLTTSEARALDGVLRRGGGLVFFLGDQVLAERYNQALFDDPQARVLPARLKELVSEAQYRFDPLNYRHRLVSAFAGREQAGLLTTPIYKYFRLEMDPKSTARVALAFEGGDPAIVEQTIHRGRSILVATEGSLSSIDPATHNPWTTMPAWPSFVPIVHELLALALSGQMSQHNVEVGQPLGDTLAAQSPRTALTVINPAGAREEVRLANDREAGLWSFADTRTCGVYKVSLPEGVSRDEYFAVNLDTAESDLTRVAPEELPREFTTERRSNLDETNAEAVGRRGALHRGLLFAVLGLLLVETLMAWRFGALQR